METNKVSKKQSKEKNPKAEQMKMIAAVVLLAIGGGFLAYDNGLLPIGESTPKRSVRTQQSPVNTTLNRNQAPLPPGSEFVQSTDPSKPSQIITKAPPPQRVATAKGLKDIVTDYVDASKDKKAAIDSLNYTMMLPSVTKEFSVQDKKTQIAKLRFEELEWQKKIAEMENSDVDGFSDGRSVSELSGIATYADRIEEGVGDISEDEEFEGPKPSDFILEGVTKRNTEFVAHLRLGDRSLRVKNNTVLFGYYTVSLNDIDDVSLCHENDCVMLY